MDETTNYGFPKLTPTDSVSDIYDAHNSLADQIDDALKNAEESTDTLEGKVNTYRTNFQHTGVTSITASGRTVTYKTTDGTSGTFTTQDTTYSNASQNTAGLMSAADKTKLDGVTASADSVSFSRSLTSGTKIGTLTINGSATDVYCNNNTTYSAATTSTAGLMSAADKNKLNGIASSANNYSHPNSGVSAGSYGPSGNVTGSNGATISVPYITVNSQGHITSIANKTYTSVNTDTNTTYNADAGIYLANGTTFALKNDVGAVAFSVPSNAEKTYTFDTNERTRIACIFQPTSGKVVVSSFNISGVGTVTIYNPTTSDKSGTIYVRYIYY